MKFIRTKYIAKTLLFLVLSGMLASCDNSIDAFQDDKGSYSVYGNLGVNQDTNFVRVYDLSTPLLTDSTRELDAQITLTNMETGQMQVLQDSIIRFDSIYTHNFFTTLDINYDTGYRLTVRGSDGKELSVTTTTPQKANTLIRENSIQLIIKWFPVTPEGIFRYSISKTSFNLGNNNKKEGVCFFYDLEGRLQVAPGFCSIIMEDPVNFRRLFIPKALFTLINNGTEKDTTFQFYIAYYHYSPDAFRPITTLDSLAIPGGAGSFGSYYKDTVKVNSEWY